MIIVWVKSRVCPALYVFVHRVTGKPVDMAELRLWAFGAFLSMYLIGV
jgi:hypothetical protein